MNYGTTRSLTFRIGRPSGTNAEFAETVKATVAERLKDDVCWSVRPHERTCLPDQGPEEQK